MATRSPAFTPRLFSTLATRFARAFNAAKVSSRSPQINAILSGRATDCMVKISNAGGGASLEPLLGSGMAYYPFVALIVEQAEKLYNPIVTYISRYRYTVSIC